MAKAFERTKTRCSVESPDCGRCYMATETASHISVCVCVALDDFRFSRLGRHFYGSSDYDDIPLCKIIYYDRGMGLMEE
jgi:hypothetical protein